MQSLLRRCARIISTASLISDCKRKAKSEIKLAIQSHGKMGSRQDPEKNGDLGTIWKCEGVGYYKCAFIHIIKRVCNNGMVSIL